MKCHCVRFTHSNPEQRLSLVVIGQQLNWDDWPQEHIVVALHLTWSLDRGIPGQGCSRHLRCSCSNISRRLADCAIKVLYVSIMYTTSPPLPGWVVLSLPKMDKKAPHVKLAVWFWRPAIRKWPSHWTPPLVHIRWCQQHEAFSFLFKSDGCQQHEMVEWFTFSIGFLPSASALSPADKCAGSSLAQRFQPRRTSEK